ncbi:MAG: GAF domain-containing protein [Chloroflexota bacterium]
MQISTPILIFTAILPLTLFLAVFNLAIWRAQRPDSTPLWLAAWLVASAAFGACRVLQYTPLGQATQLLTPRVLLSTGYALAWFGYELASAFVQRRPTRRERSLFLLCVAVPLLLLWATQLILTRQPVTRSVPFLGIYYGLVTGPLYLPANLLVLALVGFPVGRLLLAHDAHQQENHLLAVGYAFVILFSLNDFLANSLNLIWLRLSDFSYLPVAIFFTYIQIQRSGQLYRGMNRMVQERTAELSQVNAALRSEVDEHRRQTEQVQRQAAEMTALYETTRDLVIEHQLSKLLHTIVERAAGLLLSTGGGLYLCEPEQRQVRCVVSYNTRLDYTGTVLKYGEGAAGLVAETGRPLIIDDYRTWDGRANIYGSDPPFISVLSMPMLWKEQVIGVIHILDGSRPKAFSSADLPLVTQFAHQAAIAVQNVRLFEDAERRRQETSAIAEVGRDISASLQLDVVLERISAHARDLLHAMTSAVYLYDPDTQVLRAIAAQGPDANEIKQDPLNLDTGLLGPMAARKRGEIINNTDQDVRAVIIRGTQETPHEHLMGAPLLARDRLTGLIAVWRVGARQAFQSADLEFLTSLAQQAAIAIENARLFEETHRRLTELEILQSIASALRIAQAPEETFPIVLQQLVKLLKVESSLIDLIDPASGEIVSTLALGVWAPITGHRTPAGAGVSGRVIASGKPYITSRFIEDGFVAAHPELVGGLNGVAVVPIIAQHQPIGTLWVGRPVAISDEEINLLAALGEMLGNTIQRMRLHEKTVTQADEIAGAYDLTLEGWARALELRDKETEGHSRRVTELTLQLARRMKISEEDLSHIRRGVLLHDIGKMGVPDHILKKSGPLEEDERAVMQQHPRFAYDLLYPITYLRPALDVPYCHHEKWDGSGYPQGLSGEAIPLAARIFAVVDVYDALRHDRPYHNAWDEDLVRVHLRGESGRHFDPQVVECFLTMLHDGDQTAMRGQAG